MHRTAGASRAQVKAIFFILLLAGHDAVRVTEGVEWSTSKWNQLHANCSWSLKGCSEGCVRKRLPLDLSPSVSCRHTDAYLLKHNGLQNYHAMSEILLAKTEKFSKFCQKASILNRKCKRREAQILEAFRFLSRATTDDALINSLDKSELRDTLEKAVRNLARSEEEGEVMVELFRRMKCQNTELQQDPKAKVVQALLDLINVFFTSDSKEKSKAKYKIAALPDCGSGEQSEGSDSEKLKEMQEDFEQHRGDYILALDEVESAIDDMVETDVNETESNASSAMQVSLRNYTVNFIMSAAATGLISALLLSTPLTVGPVTVLLLFTWFTSFTCAVDDHWASCVMKVFYTPFKPLVLAGRYLYRRIRGNPKNIAGPVMDEPQKAPVPLVNETV